MKYLKWCFGNKARKSSPNSELHTHLVGESTGEEEPAPEHQPAPSSNEIVATDENGENDGEENVLALTDATPFNEGERMMTVVEQPPADDVCPICFGNFEVPCRATCGHWYCGSCILQYWNFTAALQPCKCPMCLQRITKLTPEASLHRRGDVEISKVLQSVGNYNRLFVGGFSGLLLRLLCMPLCIKRMFREMLNPERPGVYIHELRLIALLLGLLYSYSPFDFLLIGHFTGRRNVLHIFDYSAFALSFILYLVGLFLHARRLWNVRNLEARRAENL